MNEHTMSTHQLMRAMVATSHRIRRCREDSDTEMAQLHVRWLDTLLDEWSRRRQPLAESA